MDIVSLIISLISGIIGGNVAGAAAPNKTLSTIGNTIAGLIGGTAGGYILQALELYNKVQDTAASTGVDLTSVLGDIGSGGAGGAILTLIAGLIKNSMNKSS